MTEEDRQLPNNLNEEERERNTPMNTCWSTAKQEEEISRTLCTAVKEFYEFVSKSIIRYSIITVYASLTAQGEALILL